MAKITNLLSFYFKAKTIYNIHSPYMYQFIRDVLDTKKNYYVFSRIEHLRNVLLQSQEEITYLDFGAGSRRKKSNTRKISEIVKHNATSPKDCRILFNTMCHYRPKIVLELGTSLGIGTAYLASADKKAKIHTIEGNPESVIWAKKNFKNLQLQNIYAHQGKIAEVLPGLLTSLKGLDLVYMDGHHDRDATLAYFDMIQPYLHENSIVILDDIYWSDGMKEAWEILTRKDTVTASINIYSKGFLVFNHCFDHIQHLKYVPFWYKPWKLGIFG